MPHNPLPCLPSSSPSAARKSRPSTPFPTTTPTSTSWPATPSSTTVVAAGDLVLDLAEDLADLVFDRVRAAGLLGEAVQIREELLVDKIAQVVAGQGPVVVGLAVLAFRRRPDLPAVGLVEDECVFPAGQSGLIGQVLLEAVEVFEEEQPGRLLGVVELGRAARLFPEDVIDVFEGLFEHGDYAEWAVMVATPGGE